VKKFNDVSSNVKNLKSERDKKVSEVKNIKAKIVSQVNI
jgi:hypothetical protein